MSVALNALHFTPKGNPGRRMITSQSEQELLRRDLDLAAQLPRDGSENAGVATAEPPLYYAVEAIPYLIASRGTVLDRLQLMRLISALLAGLTGLFVFLFVREALPGEPWAWSTAGLGVAVTPLLGFMSGAVNPDAGLFAVSAALFFCFARAFRRGLTRRLAGATGAVIAIGVLTKLNFVGLLPGALVGLLILSLRARTSLYEACLRIALACTTATAPVLAALATGALRSHGGPHRLTSGLTHFLADGSLKAQLYYVWQLYLPRLPGMANDFPDLFTSRQIWFDGFVGAYGWGETVFASWVYDIALVPAAAIAGLTIRAVYRRRAALRGRAVEIGVYTLMSLGVLLMIAAASYTYFPVQNADFARARYLLPMLALLGALLALAARGAGRRWGPAAGVLIVVVMLDHDIFSQLLVVAHYYGQGGPPVG
jgi:4-amino-4-deoxy-L-arabinose transferase-like glycosyltransferase